MDASGLRPHKEFESYFRYSLLWMGIKIIKMYIRWEQEEILSVQMVAKRKSNKIYVDDNIILMKMIVVKIKS